MATIQTSECICDNCGKKVPGHSSLNIVTEKSETEDQFWSRLRIRIFYEHGQHNDGEESDANLCKKCALLLLNDAVERVKKGERASEGVESTRRESW